MQYPKEIPVSKIKTLPVPYTVKSRIYAKIMDCMKMYEAKGVYFKTPSISFDLRGKTAGKAFYTKNHIQLNAVLLLENIDDFVNTVVGHELAHLADYVSSKGKIVEPHGSNWQKMMKIIGQSPDRVHDYDTTNSGVLKQYLYKCACKEYLLSSRRKNSGNTYICKLCKQPLVPVKKEKHSVEIPLDTPTVHHQEDSPSSTTYKAPAVPVTQVRAPTENMVKFAKAISDITGVLLTEDILHSFEKTKNYIDLNKNRPPEPPTEKQIKYAQSIAHRKNMIIPSSVLKSKSAISKWIDEQLRS